MTPRPGQPRIPLHPSDRHGRARKLVGFLADVVLCAASIVVVILAVSWLVSAMVSDAS